MRHDLGATNLSVEVLRSFVALLDIGSIAKAADHLLLTQAGLNAQIKRLQKQIGDKLFLSAGPALTLTEKGGVLLGYARRMLEMNDRIISQAGRAPDRRHIGIPAVYASAFLEEVNLACARLTPHRPAAFVCESSDELAKSLLLNFLDVAVLIEKQSLSTVTEFSWKEPLVWACAENVLARPGSPLPLITAKAGSIDQVGIKSLLYANVPCKIVLVAADLNVRMAAAEVGLGYLIVPRRMLPASLKVAQENFLPVLDDLQCAVHVSPQIDPKKIQELLLQLADIVMPPLERGVCDHAPGVAEFLESKGPMCGMSKM